MPRNFSKSKEFNENKAKELNDKWHEFISESNTNLLNSLYGMQRGEMIPGYWYDRKGKIVDDK